MFEINENHKKRVAIYCRVSTDEQAINGTSLDSQKESLVNYVKTNSDKYILDEDRHIYIDGGYSGGTDNRPALKQLMIDSKKDEFDMVLVFKLDRFFRKTLLLLQYIEDLQDYNIGFKSITQEFDTSGYGKMIIGFLGIMAEFERDMIRERTVLGKVKKAKQGYYVGGGGIKYGYDTIQDGNGIKLIVNEEESKIVKRIFNMYVNEKKSLYNISEILSNEKILTKYDKQHEGKDHNKRLKTGYWHTSNLKGILGDEMYIGKYYYGKTYSKKDRKTGREITYFREKGDPLLVEMPCPRILEDDEIFYKAKELLEKNKNNKNKDRTYNFTGYIECGKCGKKYIGYKSRKNTISYRCGGSVGGKVPKEFRCDNNEISENFILDTVWKQINRLLKNPEKVLEEYYKNNGTQLDVLSQYKDELVTINQEIELNTNGLSHIYTEYYTEKDKNIKKIKENTIEIYKSKIVSLNSRKEELESKIEKFSKTERNKTNIKRVVNKFVSKFKNKIDENKKVEIIKEFVDRIKVLEDGNIIIGLKFFTGNNNENSSDEGG